MDRTISDVDRTDAGPSKAILEQVRARSPVDFRGDNDPDYAGIGGRNERITVRGAGRGRRGRAGRRGVGRGRGRGARGRRAQSSQSGLEDIPEPPPPSPQLNIPLEEPNEGSEGVSDTSSADLNKAIPTTILGGLLNFSGEQMNDPQLWSRVVEAMRVNQELANQMRAIMREREENNPNNPPPAGAGGRMQTPLLLENPQQQIGQLVSDIRQLGITDPPQENRMGATPYLRPEREGRLGVVRIEGGTVPVRDLGMALAGCKVRFTPRGTISRIPKQMTLPSHSGFPPNDLIEYIEGLAEYAIVGGGGKGVLRGRVHDPGSA